MKIEIDGLAWLILNISLVVIVFFGCLAMVYLPDNTPKVQTTGCFYDWQLSYECHTQNGSIIPVVKNNQSYWTCSTQNYEVLSC